MESNTIEKPIHNLPIAEEDLWPQGELLHLNGTHIVGFWKSPVKHKPVVILTRDELIIALAPNKQAEAQTRQGYIFRAPDLKEAYRCPSMDISRILISHWGVSTALSIWIRNQDSREKKILKAVFIQIPSTIVTLAEEAAGQGLLKPAALSSRHIYDMEIERQFRLAAPNARVTLRANRISDDVWNRLVR